jgi:hypothetical protein
MSRMLNDQPNLQADLLLVVKLLQGGLQEGTVHHRGRLDS